MMGWGFSWCPGGRRWSRGWVNQVAGTLTPGGGIDWNFQRKWGLGL